MPRLLDLFCGAGGAAVGYSRAGFEVVGIDVEPQPSYPFHFILGDALAYARAGGLAFDAIHASPPCQFHSTVGKQARLTNSRALTSTIRTNSASPARANCSEEQRKYGGRLPFANSRLARAAGCRGCRGLGPPADDIRIVLFANPGFFLPARPLPSGR